VKAGVKARVKARVKVGAKAGQPKQEQKQELNWECFTLCNEDFSSSSERILLKTVGFSVIEIASSSSNNLPRSISVKLAITWLNLSAKLFTECSVAGTKLCHM
jgi:hypothetical protein